jgi:NADH-quinone oxidoreductase subunit J
MSFLTAQAVFYYMASASVVSALLAVTRKNPVHSMLWVLGLILHVAGIFLLLQAEFLAAVQVIVYAGAILVFYLFVLMLLDLPGETARPRFGRHWPFAVAAGLGFIVLTSFAHVETAVPANAELAFAEVSPAAPQTQSVTDPPPLGSLADIGTKLFGPFALPFEIASLVLLAAIVGAVVLARRRAVES